MNTARGPTRKKYLARTMQDFTTKVLKASAMRGQDFRRATPSRVGLPSLGVGKLDQALYLGNGQGRKPLAQFVDSLPEVVTVNDGVGHNARTAHDGPSRYLAGDFLDQFALHPDNVRICV